MSKKPQYDPEEIRYPDQVIVASPLVPEMEKSYIEYAMRKAAKSGVKFLVLPELGLTGYTCGDLFYQETLLRGAEEALATVLEATRPLNLVAAVGLPLRFQNHLYNCAAVIQSGKILGVTVKAHLPNYGEFYEKRQFTPAPDEAREITLCGQTVPFGARLVYECRNVPGLSLGVEICEDLWVPGAPSLSMFLTGTDEHGQKIESKAKEAGISPQQFVDNIVEGPKGVKDLWKLMNISYDRFIRTTDGYHVESIQKIFKKLYDNGDIYKSTYKGKYCTPCESFWTESQLVNGCCPDCGRPVVDAEEEAYFFRLSKYADRVRDLLENTDFLQPKSRVNEMVHNFIDPGLEDLCVSRTSFTWGIPVTFDPKHVVYVWVDALSNYITALGYENEAYHGLHHLPGQSAGRRHADKHVGAPNYLGQSTPFPLPVGNGGDLLLDGVQPIAAGIDGTLTIRHGARAPEPRWRPRQCSAWKKSAKTPTAR